VRFIRSIKICSFGHHWLRRRRFLSSNEVSVYITYLATSGNQISRINVLDTVRISQGVRFLGHCNPVLCNLNRIVIVCI
jgi:hypothetical protein